MGFVFHRHPIDALDHIDTDEKFMLYYLASKEKINLPVVIFKYLRDVIRRYIIGSSNDYP